jgi:NMD protein affecting ribosome stability and mRNA decay
MAEAKEAARRHEAQVEREELEARATREALEDTKAEDARIAKRERQAASMAPTAATLRLDTAEVTDSEADVQMALQTPTCGQCCRRATRGWRS